MLEKITKLLADPNGLCSDFPHWTPLHEVINQLEEGGTILGDN